MRRPPTAAVLSAALAWALALAACRPPDRAPEPGRPAGSAPVTDRSIASDPIAEAPRSVPVLSPRPNAPIPAGVRGLAFDLRRVTRAVRASVADWTRDDGASAWPPPETLVLQTLYQQRIYRSLARRPAFARRVVARLPPTIRREASAIVRANTAVFAHARPVPPSFRVRTRAPEAADELRGYYDEAQRRFGVPWEVLASINYVESKFGRVVSSSSVGARGPMQFLPSTWSAYGLGGDVRDARDAVLGAANYLRANGARSRLRAALYRYNPVASYVEAVATYAAAMRRDPRLYYAMYCWQVYVLTTRGDRRVTGPGPASG
jgi:hypothetical protein